MQYSKVDLVLETLKTFQVLKGAFKKFLTYIKGKVSIVKKLNVKGLFKKKLFLIGQLSFVKFVKNNQLFD